MKPSTFVLLASLSMPSLLVSCTPGTTDETRMVISLNPEWRFARDLPGEVAYYASDFDDTSWETVTLPHTPRIEPLVVNDQWRGDAWYRKSFAVDEAHRGMKVFVRFEGAMQIADVWLNGEHLGTHAGGYLPFAFDVTDHVRFGEPNLLAVKLNNDDNPWVPPGKPLAVLDFNYFGGIYRNVDLILTEDLYVSDPILAGIVGGGGVYAYSSGVSDTVATVHVKVHVQNDARNPQDASVRIMLRNTAGHATRAQTKESVELSRTTSSATIPPGGSHHFTESLRIARPRLWSPNEPSLYELTTEVLRSGQVSDAVVTRLGIRDLRVSASGGFQINGERVYLRGTNRHQEYPYVGYALSDEAQYRDAVKIKNAGFDMVRLSHYPHAEAFMRAADEIGLILMDAIPGWQFFGDSTFQTRSLNDIRQMVRRDRNHASVAFWEVSLNESGMDDAFMVRANEVLREELPEQRAYTAGWMDHASYDVFIPARQHSRPPDYWSKYNKDDRPILIAEYGDWEYYAHNAGFRQDAFEDLTEEERTSRQLRGFGEKRLLQQALNYQEAANSNRKGPATVGDANWLMFDYNRGYADDIEASGIGDLFRLPKFAYYFYQSQRPPSPILNFGLASGPMVFIANYWEPTSTTEVRVFSNTDEVELYLNGDRIERRGPDRNRMTSHLPYPPFTFDLQEFEAGTLRAVGYIGGQQAASHEVTTPGAASGLKLEIDLSGVGLSTRGEDVLFVYAHVLDGDGQPVPGDSSEVRFSIRGTGRLVGRNPVNAEAGIASILLRTELSHEPITILAQAADLSSDSLQIER